MVGAIPRLWEENLPLAATAGLCLQLVSGRQAGRTVTLNARKCTIGSAPHCTLRLKSPGIEGLHCVIDRTGEQAVVRRLAGAAWLNGQPFDETLLKPGDCLRLATIEFEIVAVGVEQPSASQVPDIRDTEGESSRPLDGLPPEALASDAELRQSLEGRLDELQTALAQMGRDLVQKAESRDDWADALAARVQAEMAQAAPNWASEVTHEVAPRVTTQVTADVLSWLESELAALVERLSVQIPIQVAANVTDDVAARVRAEVGQSLGKELSSQIAEQVTAATGILASRTTSDMSQQVTDRIAELSSRLSDQVSQSTNAAVDQLAAHVTQELYERLTGEVQRQVASEIGQQSSRWRSDVAETLTGDVTQRAAAQLLPELLAQISKQVSEHVQQQVSQATGQAMEQASGQLSRELFERLKTEVQRSVAEQAAAQIADAAPQQWNKQLAEEVAAQVDGLQGQIAREVTDRVRNNLGEQIATQVARQVAAEQASFEAQRTAWEQQQHKSQGEINTHAQHLEQRLEALMRFERGLDEQHQQWQHDLHALRPEIHNIAEQTGARLSALEQHQERALAEQESWKAELKAWQDAAASGQQRLEQRFDELAQRLETVQRDQRGESSDIASDDRAEQVDQRLAEIRAQREAFEHDRHLGAPERNLLHPGEHARDLDERLAELHASRKAMQRERQHTWETGNPGDCQDHSACGLTSAVEAAAPQPPLDDLAPAIAGAAEETFSEPDTEPAPPAPPSPALPSQMFAHLLRDEETEQHPGAEPSRPLMAAVVQPEPDAHHAHHGHEDEDSIENYMSRLMDRVRGLQSGPASSTGKSAQPEVAASPSRLQASAKAVLAVPAEPELPMVKDLSELAPRNAPAESTSNISAMRDLANLTARSAIDAHSRKRMQSVVWGKLIVAFVALAAAAALTWMSGHGGRVAYSAALVSTIVAVIWGIEYLVLSGYSFWKRQSPSTSTPKDRPVASRESVKSE